MNEFGNPGSPAYEPRPKVEGETDTERDARDAEWQAMHEREQRGHTTFARRNDGGATRPEAPLTRDQTAWSDDRLSEGDPFGSNYGQEVQDTDSLLGIKR